MIKLMFPDGSGVPVIRLGTDEYEAWASYFQDHLQWKPWALGALQQQKIQEMTVPAQWPEWFDTSYSSGGA